MATATKRKLTKKEKGFVKDYRGRGTGAATVRKHYDSTTSLTERAIASENLTKPHIQQALADSGFTEDNAKNVTAEIMLNTEVEPNARLKATDQVFKVHGSYAPDRPPVTVNILSINATDPAVLASLQAIQDRLENEN